MTKFHTHLTKMPVSLEDEVQYHLRQDNGDMLHMNPLIGSEIAISFDGVFIVLFVGKRLKSLLAMELAILAL